MKIALLIMTLLLTSQSFTGDLPIDQTDEITLIQSPDDLSSIDRGHNITWVAISSNASVYFVEVDGNYYTGGNWISNQPITILVTEFLPAFYNFTIELRNDFGFRLFDSVLIRIVDMNEISNMDEKSKELSSSIETSEFLDMNRLNNFIQLVFILAIIILFGLFLSKKYIKN